MKTTQDWLRELEELYDGQKTGRIKAVQAVEMNNTVGKVISLAKLQLDYDKTRKMMGENLNQIPMLERINGNGGDAKLTEPSLLHSKRPQ